MWTPRKGDIVRVKPGFDRSLEAVATRRAGLPLKENCLYQVLDSKPGETGVVLILGEVRVFRVGGVRYVVKGKSESFPYVAGRFDIVHTNVKVGSAKIAR